ncbi:MAG: ABC transporter ATP-binding protein [Hyphomicrobiaceae bacterium]
MTGSLLLEIDELRLGYETGRGVARVLDGVSLSIGRGRIMGLVGESGCGKTTLARAVLGILAANANIESGGIRFDGEDLLGMDRRRFQREIKGRRISFIPQDPYGAFNPLFRVGDQIMELMKWKSPRRAPGEKGLGALMTPYPRARKKADREEALRRLEEVQIPDPERAFGKLPGEFSGGQRQRLMIAMALMTEPDLIIADEPTTALDVTIQAQILKLIKGLGATHGVSVLLTTHDLGTAYEICDDITVMYAGQEVEIAPVETFFAQPRHPYTVRLLESLPAPGREIHEIAGEIPSLVEPPSGCRFHPRCERAKDVCRASRPPVSGALHRFRCFDPVPVPGDVEVPG